MVFLFLLLPLEVAAPVGRPTDSGRTGNSAAADAHVPLTAPASRSPHFSQRGGRQTASFGRKTALGPGDRGTIRTL